MLGKSFPFHFKMHDITPHFGSNLDSALMVIVDAHTLELILGIDL